MIDLDWNERGGLSKPEPEPSWRSLYGDEKSAHAETKRVLKLYIDAFGTVLSDREGYVIG